MLMCLVLPAKRCPLEGKKEISIGDVCGCVSVDEEVDDGGAVVGVGEDDGFCEGGAC